MRKGWEMKKLSDVCELSAGGDVPKDDYSENKTDKHQVPIYANGEKNEGFYGYTSKAKVTKPSITVSARGTIGYTVKRQEPFFPIVRLIVATPTNLNELSLGYLDYAMRKIDFKHSGSSIPQLTVPMIRDYEIPIPPLSEQKEIVSILDSAFESIERAKSNAEQNLKNAKELFDSFLNDVFESKGKDWEEKRFEDLTNLITCGVAATPKYVDKSEGIPFLSAQNVKDGKVVLDNYRYISKQFHHELTKKNKPKKGDILYSRVGSKFGEAGVVEHEFEFSVYVSLTLIKTKAEILDNYYLKYYLNSPLIKDLAKKSISSSGVPNLNVKDVREFPIKCPPILIQKKIVKEIEIVSTETKKLEAIYQQKLNDLEELKKSILQKAFNGELKTSKISA